MIRERATGGVGFTTRIQPTGAAGRMGALGRRKRSRPTTASLRGQSTLTGFPTTTATATAGA